MDKKIVTKVIAAILAFTLTFANIALLGIYTQEVYAANVNLETQNTAVEKANIEFDAYFLNEGETKHSKDIDVRANSDKLYLKLKVLDGYLANATVKIANANFKLKQNEEKLDLVQSIDTENGVITLNKIDKNESVVLEVPIEMNTDSNFSVENFNKVSKIILEGTYVNSKAKETNIYKEIEVSANINAKDITANLEENVSKYVQFNVNGNKGVILQTIIKSNIAGNVLPVKQTDMKIEIPRINGVEPTTVVLSAISTKATNGETNKTLTSEDYEYKNGVVTLTLANNQKENGAISWEKNSQDELALTCVYGEEAIVKNANITLNASADITLYNNEASIIKANKNEVVTLNEQIGNIVTFGLETSTDKFEKGQMLVENSQNISYVETISSNIGYRELVDSIIIDSKINYLDERKNNYPSNAIYTYTKVDREKFIEMLGQDGYINIYGKNGEKIATLNIDNLEHKYETETTYIKIETSKAKSEGILKIENGREIKPAEYSEEQTKMFKQMEEKISAKVMNKEQELLNDEQSKVVELLDPRTVIETSMNKTNLSTVENNENVELKVVLNSNDASKSLYKNPKLTVEFPSYVETLSEGKIGLLYEDELKLGKVTMFKNEEQKVIVEIPLEGEQSTFNTSAVSNGATVIINGNLKVNELAPAINDEVKVYVTNENETVYETEENGRGISKAPIKYAAQNKVITRNTISGYNNQNAEIKAQDENKTAIIYAKSESKTATVKIDVVNSTSNEINNVVILGRIPFAGNKSVVTGEDLNSKFTANMVSEINATYGISKQDIKIYYSESENANTDLSDKNNGWVTSLDLAKVKSYLIVIGDRTVNFGDRMSFEYNVQIPENLEGDLGTYSTYAVYYNEIQKEAESDQVTNVKKEEQASTVGVKTEKVEVSQGEAEAPVINPEDKQEEQKPADYTTFNKDELSIYINRTGTKREQITNADTVKEGEYIDYTVQLRNLSQTDTMTFDMVAYKENGTFYGKGIVGPDIYGNDLHGYKELEDETLKERVTLKPGEVFEYKYSVIPNKGTAGSTLKSSIAVEQNGNKLNEIALVNQIEEGKLKFDVTYNRTEETPIYSNDEMPIAMQVTNITDETLSNVKLTMVLPEDLEYTENSEYGEVNEYNSIKVNGKTIEITINSLEAGKTSKIYILTTTKELPKELEEKEISIYAEATVGNEKALSNTYTNTINQVKTNVKATFTASSNREWANHGDEIIYTLVVENTGSIEERNLTIEDKLMAGLKVKDYTIIYPDGKEETKETSYQNVNITDLVLKPGEKITIKIKVIVDEDIATKYLLSNYMTISGYTFDTFNTDTISYKIDFEHGTEKPEEPEEPKPPVDPEDPEEPKPPVDPEEPDDPKPPVDPEDPDDPKPPVKETYAISGTVWNDANADGKRDNDENVIPEMTVMLMDNQKYEFVKDSSGKEITAKTNSNGVYKFSDLSVGEYIVVFMYDTNLYMPTSYQKNGVPETHNSDAINGNVTINGINTKVAVTDIINIKQSNEEHIDLGLITANKFDLKLDKIVNTVIVQNKQGTKTYTFKNNKTAKVEIPSKYMAGSNLTIEYKISVTNEGDVPGKATKIADYIPKDLTFSPEINPEWYRGTDGSIYTEELANTVINPGETKEVTLVLTKVVKEAAAETVNNSAEISTHYNSLGLEDIDSKPGNNAQKEDDQSSADLIITIKTGVLTYTLIVLGIAGLVAIAGLGIYLIKKKVLIKNI